MYESCWTRVPYASIVAMMFLMAGSLCFCVNAFKGFDEVEMMMRHLFNVHEQVIWIGSLKVALVVAGTIMAAYSILLLVFGVLATGSTRKNVYSGANCILGGRCTAIFFMVLTYLANLAWLVVTCGMAIPLVYSLMMQKICDTEFDYQKYQPGDTGLGLHCFNMTRLGLYFPGWNEEYPNDFWYGPATCKISELSEMCSVVTEVLPLFAAALAGSAIIVISLVTFLMIISVNYQRIKTSKELTDYRDALEQDNTEMDNIIASRKHFQSSYVSDSDRYDT